MPSLSYGNIPIVACDWNHAAQSFLDRFQRVEDLILWAREGVSERSWESNPAQSDMRIGRPTYNFPPQPPFRVGQLYWPCTGASRFAYGIFLCTTEQKEAIEELDCTIAHELVSTTSTNPPVPGTDGEDDPLCTVRFKLYVWSFHRFAGVMGEPCEKTDGIVTNNDLYLLILVDRRAYWQFIGAANFSSILESQDSECNITCAVTWNDLFQNLGEVLGITFEAYTQADAYEYVGPCTDELKRPYDNAALLLDALAASVGGRFVMRYDGTGAIEHPAEALATLQSNLAAMKQQLAGYDCEDIQARTRPTNVQVVFPKLRYHHQPCEPEYLAITVANADPGCGFPITKTIHSTSFADMGNDCGVGSVPVNYSDLLALAQQIAADEIAWREYEYDFTFSSPRPWTPCGFDDHVLFKFGQEHEDVLEAATSLSGGPGGESQAETALEQLYRREHYTRIQSLPLSVGVDSMWHGTDAEILPDEVLVELTDCWKIDDPCCDYICENSPAWPRNLANVMNWCDCDWTNSGTQIYVHLSTGFLCNSSMRQQLQQLVAYCGSNSGASQSWGCLPIRAGCGELLWAKWNCQSERYEAVAGYDDIWKFELNEELCSGESAEAHLILWDCCNDNKTDPEGWIHTQVAFTVNDNLELICPNKTYGVQTEEGSSGGACSCTCSTGCLPVGSRGFAKYSPSRCAPNECYFDLLSFQSCDVPMFAYIELNQDLCAETGEEVDIAGTAKFPNNPTWSEQICKVKARMRLYACNGDTVLLIRDCNEAEDICWSIVNVQDHAIPIVKDVNYSDNCDEETSAAKACSFTKTRAPAIGVHTCDCGNEDDVTEDIMTTETLDVVIGAGLAESCCETSGAAFVEYQFITRKICAIPCGDAEGRAVAASLVPSTVITFLGDDGECVYYDYATLYGFCICDESYGNVLFCTEECTPSSSSLPPA